MTDELAAKNDTSTGTRGPLAREHGDPIWAATQEAGLSFGFRTGAGDMSDLVQHASERGTKASFARGDALALLDDQSCLANLTFGGVRARFPDLDFAAVESGVGWLSCVLVCSTGNG